MVERVRQDLEADRRAHLRWIEWLTPGIVWAMDFTGYPVEIRGKVYLHNTQDLGSRYKFLPMAGTYPVGEEVAGPLAGGDGEVGGEGVDILLQHFLQGFLGQLTFVVEGITDGAPPLRIKLDPESTNLHLIVCAAQILKFAIGQVATEIAGPVEPIFDRFVIPAEAGIQSSPASDVSPRCNTSHSTDISFAFLSARS